MTDKELIKLLALKRCEQPSQERLEEVERLFRYNLRLERIRQKTRPTHDLWTLQNWILRWAPAAVSVVVIFAGILHMNQMSVRLQTAQNSRPQIQNATPWHTGTQNAIMEFFRDVAPDMPVAAPVTRSFALEATPVVFDESRITY